MVGKEDDPLLPYWGPPGYVLKRWGEYIYLMDMFDWVFGGASGRLTAQFFAVTGGNAEFSGTSHFEFHHQAVAGGIHGKMMGGIPPIRTQELPWENRAPKDCPVYIYIVPWPRFDLQIFYMDLVGRGSV